MGKITVKHFLNKRLKDRFVGGEYEYPLYVQIIVNRKKTQLKSKHNVYLTEDKFKNGVDGNDLKLNQYLESEIQIIKKVIKSLNPDSEKFHLKGLPNLYKNYTTSVLKFIDNGAKSLYYTDLKRVAISGVKEEWNENVTVSMLAHLFERYLNWEKSNFWLMRKGVIEALPNVMDVLEKHIDKEVMEYIAAYFDSYSIILDLDRKKRDIKENKIVRGLTYVEWIEGGKKELYDMLVQKFGEVKAKDYVFKINEFIKVNLG